MKTSFEGKILGAIIKNPASPTTNYVPEDPAPITYVTRELQEGCARDFLLNGAGGRSQSAEASLTSIGGFRVAGATEASVHLAGKLVRHKRIQQLDQFWEQLRKDATVQESVPRWVKKRSKQPVCLVIGIMISEGSTEYETEARRTREWQGNGEIPMGQIASAAAGTNPLSKAGNVQLSAGLSNHTGTDLKASVDESNIFAVELKQITTPWFSRRRLELKDGDPSIDSTRLAGTGSDKDWKDDVIVDDLVLEDVDAHMMTELLS